MLDNEYLLSMDFCDDLAAVILAPPRDRGCVFVDIFQRIFCANEVMLFVFQGGLAPQVILHITSNALRSSQIQDYRDGLYLTDPFYLALERSATPYALGFHDLLDRDSFEETEFYRRHYAATGLVDEFCYSAFVETDSWLLLSFARSKESGRYSAEEVDHAKRLAPVVNAVLQSSWSGLVKLSPLEPPSRKEEQLYDNLQRARSNFGKSILTDREFEVVQHMLRGYTIDTLAKRLSMAEGTAKVHRRNIYRKLDISSHAELFSLFLAVISSVPLVDDSDPMAQYDQR